MNWKICLFVVVTSGQILIPNWPSWYRVLQSRNTNIQLKTNPAIALQSQSYETCLAVNMPPNAFLNLLPHNLAYQLRDTWMSVFRVNLIQTEFTDWMVYYESHRHRLLPKHIIAGMFKDFLQICISFLTNLPILALTVKQQALMIKFSFYHKNRSFLCLE